MSVGDALFYNAGVYHRTSDSINDREALSMDVRLVTNAGQHEASRGDVGARQTETLGLR